MPSIKLEKICKFICRDVGLTINDRELLVLLGPSGAGKTTLLNIIAGLTEYEGSVLFDSQRVDKLPASKREVGYLFQDLFLFPHLDVSANIAYGLKARKSPHDGIEGRVAELLHLMKISHLAGRYPRQLSGGEKQRVALARALALSPQLLLLDEPMSSLDAQTAKYLRTELKQLQRQLGITTIYVTHDLDEAEEMADRIAVIQEGRLQQLGKPEEVFFYPANEVVSDFIGAPNILHCDHCRSLGQGVMEADCGAMKIILPDDGNKVRRIALFPRDIYVSEVMPPGPAVNRFKGVLTAIRPMSDAVRLEIRVAEHRLLAEVPHHIFEDMDLSPGQEVFLILKLRRIKVH
jgi:ABC-type Fe3+/spermidine/putrescine transport system ATPase subunit